MKRIEPDTARMLLGNCAKWWGELIGDKREFLARRRSQWLHHTHRVAFTVLFISAVLALVTVQQISALPRVDYTRSALAQRQWHERGDARPVEVKKTATGQSALVFTANFTGPGKGASWEWSGPTDLSNAEGIVVDVEIANSARLGMFGIYFGSFGRWKSSLRNDLKDGEQELVYYLDAFRAVGGSLGWNELGTFRMTAWSSQAGSATIEIRSIQVIRNEGDTNWTKNGSFEIVDDGMPYAWGTGHWGVMQTPWAIRPELLHQHWYVDSTTSVDGQNSLCIYNVAGMPLLGATSAWVSPPTTAQSYVLSIWMKADSSIVPVEVSIGSRQQTFTPTLEWRQHDIRDVPPGERYIVSIRPKGLGHLWIDAVQLRRGTVASSIFDPHPGDAMASGENRHIDWSLPSGKVPLTADVIDHPTHPIANVSTADSRGILVNGVPYIPFALGFEYVPTSDLVDYVAQLGFRDVCVQISKNTLPSAFANLLDRSLEDGIRVIPRFTSDLSIEQVSHYVSVFKNNPALLAWYVMDEPRPEQMNEAALRVERTKEIDPSRPAFVNYVSQSIDNQIGDIYSTDIYTIPHGGPIATILEARRLVSGAKNAQRPAWMWVQGTGFAYDLEREPTPRELSAMVYGSLIEGVRGFYLFSQIPHTTALLGEMRRLAIEITRLSPILGAAEDSRVLQTSNQSVLARLYQTRRGLWLLAVNTTAARQEAEISLPNVYRTASEEFDGRVISLDSSSLRDEFGPYGRHVYELASVR